MTYKYMYKTPENFSNMIISSKNMINIKLNKI